MDKSSQSSSWAKTLFKTLPKPSSASEERVYAEMQRLMVRLLIPMAIINLVNGLIYSVAFLQYVEAWRVAVWLTPVLLFSSMQSRKRFSSSVLSENVLACSFRIFLIFCFC